MSLETETCKTVVQGNGVTTVFPYAFIIPDADYAIVTFTDDEGTQIVLNAAQYTITGIDDPNGGTVTYPLVGSPMATGESLTIERTVPYIQPTVLRNQTNYYPDVVEGADDFIVMQTQQLAEQMSRTIRFPVVDPALNSDGELPAWQLRANTIQGFDSNGNVQLVDQTGGALSSASNVNFVQMGLSAYPGLGAYSRTLQDKGQDSLNIMDFIPTAEHAAIRAYTSTYSLTTIYAAIIAAYKGTLAADPQGCTINFPPGLYNGVFNCAQNNIVLDGSGMTTILKNNSASTPLLTFTGSGAPTCDFCGVKNMTLRNNFVPAHTLYGLSATYFTASNLFIEEHGHDTTAGKYGVALDSCTLSYVENVRCRDIGTTIAPRAYGGHLRIDTSFSTTVVQFSAGKGDSGGNDYPIYVDVADGVNFHGLYVDPGDKGIGIFTRSQNVSINGFAMESDDTRDQTGQIGHIVVTQCQTFNLRSALMYIKTATGTPCPHIYLGDNVGVNIDGFRPVRATNTSSAAIPFVNAVDNDNTVIQNVVANNRTSVAGSVGLAFTFFDNNLAGLNLATNGLTLRNIKSDAYPSVLGTAGTPTYAVDYVKGLVIENADGNVVADVIDGMQIDGIVGTIAVTASAQNGPGGTVTSFGPSFLARVTADVLNVIGNTGVAYTIPFATELYDNNGNYNNGTYTYLTGVAAPHTFTGIVALAQLAAANTSMLVELVTTARTYPVININPGALRNAANELSVNFAQDADMQFAQTAFVRVTVTGGVGDTVDILATSYFSGRLNK